MSSWYEQIALHRGGEGDAEGRMFAIGGVARVVPPSGNGRSRQHGRGTNADGQR